MIDIENELFTAIVDRIHESYPDCFCTMEHVDAPPAFPCFEMIERDNAAWQSSQDSGSMENHAAIMWETQVYSNRARGKKSECKAIARIVDDVMLEMGIDRTFLDSLPNMADATIYRILGRYRAVVGKDGTIYRR